MWSLRTFRRIGKVSTIFLDRNAKIRLILCVRIAQKRFWTITLYMSILGHMLLHNININEAIAYIVLYQQSLCDLPRPRCKNSEAWENIKKGVVNCGQRPTGQNIYPRQICSLWVPWSVPVVKCRVGSCISGTVTRSRTNKVWEHFKKLC